MCLNKLKIVDILRIGRVIKKNFDILAIAKWSWLVVGKEEGKRRGLVR